MGILRRFDPPAFLPDFGAIPGQLDAWHNAVSNWFDISIDSDRPLVPGGRFQFYNPAHFDPAGPVVEQAITWNAFPFGRDRAMQEADTLWTIDRYYSDLLNVPVDKGKFPELYQTFFRPQDEYCEWHVVRDQQTNRILRATYTSEPPELWYALFGGTVPNDSNRFPGDRSLLLSKYRELVSPDIQADDLVAKQDIIRPQGSSALKGEYNPYNRWNTTHGIVHLGAPPNSLTAEIQLGADATVLRQDSHGRLLVEADALICCAAYGGPDRNSDPTIGAAVNALARLGAYVTLKNPVGLYMDHIDLSGWEAPDGKGVNDCVRIVRGMPQMIERLIVEVPRDRGFTVGDLTIGGVPIDYGGQIAECITVNLVGIANLQSAPISNNAVACDGRCCVDQNHPTALMRSVRLGSELPEGTQAAFVEQGATEARASARRSETEAKELSRHQRRSKFGLRTRSYSD